MIQISQSVNTVEQKYLFVHERFHYHCITREADDSLAPPLPTHNEPKDDGGGKGSQEPLPRLLRREFDQTSATKEKPCEGVGVEEGGVCGCRGRGIMCVWEAEVLCM